MFHLFEHLADRGLPTDTIAKTVAAAQSETVFVILLTKGCNCSVGYTPGNKINKNEAVRALWSLVVKRPDSDG